MKIKWIHSKMYEKILRRKIYWIIQWLHPPQQYSSENTHPKRKISLSVFYDKSSFHQHFGCCWCSSLLLLPAADVVCIRVASDPTRLTPLSLFLSRKTDNKMWKMLQFIRISRHQLSRLPSTSIMTFIIFFFVIDDFWEFCLRILILLQWFYYFLNFKHFLIDF